MQVTEIEKVIEFRSVTKRYKTMTAVDDVSLDVYRGEFFGLLGHNGAGKTTLVEMIEGIKQPESGSIRILERTWAKDESYLRMKLSGVLRRAGVAPASLGYFEATRAVGLVILRAPGIETSVVQRHR